MIRGQTKVFVSFVVLCKKRFPAARAPIRLRSGQACPRPTIRVIRAIRGGVHRGAREATICSSADRRAADPTMAAASKRNRGLRGCHGLGSGRPQQPDFGCQPNVKYPKT